MEQLTPDQQLQFTIEQLKSIIGNKELIILRLAQQLDLTKSQLEDLKRQLEKEKSPDEAKTP